MADTPPTACARTWARTFDAFTELNHSLEQAPAQDRDQMEREIAAIQDELLGTPAPTFNAVRQKLEMLWETKMHGLDQDSEERRLVIEDLKGLIGAQRALLGS
jgi:HPt (histidine-containing phosphotransfer) domain-containing protein